MVNNNNNNTANIRYNIIFSNQIFRKLLFLDSKNNYSNDNIIRMQKGLAPLDDNGISIELHHPNGRLRNNFYNFYPVTQAMHRLIHYGG